MLGRAGHAGYQSDARASGRKIAPDSGIGTERGPDREIAGKILVRE